MSQTIGNIAAAQGSRRMRREGKSLQDEAKRNIDNFEWQELTNPYKDTQVSTMGSELMVDENARLAAAGIDAARAAGTRGIAGAVPKIQAGTAMLNAKAAANLDEQQKQLDYAAAGQDAQNQAIIENRQANELAGYGQMFNVGMGMKYKAYSDFQATSASQSQHVMDLFQTFGGGMGGGAMGGGGGAAGGAGGGGAAPTGGGNTGMWSW